MEQNIDEGNSSGNEITAEWIVRAQLKIVKPKKKAASFGASDCCTSDNSPCRIIYKWNSEEPVQANKKNVKILNEKVRVTT
jgi:hypothetical protein